MDEVEKMSRPQGRQRHVSGIGNHVSRHGSGIGGGPVGPVPGSGRGGFNGGRRSGGSGGRSPLIFLFLLIVIAAVIGRSCLCSSLGTSSGTSHYDTAETLFDMLDEEADSTSSSSSDTGWSTFQQMLGGGSESVYSVTGSSTAWSGREANTGVLDTSVAEGSREKFTKLGADGTGNVTIMVYMCGADLETKNGMATRDLQEMIEGDPGENVSLLVYTGGASQWQNNAVSSSVCQIWQVADGGLTCLVEDDGDRSMTDPDTLTRFIRYASQNYPSSRNELILWDHGGGSVSGYGYDENHSARDSMDLAEINTAIEDGGVTFDFIGFDACLMATAENALSLSDSADYLIASEETEPGTGWYYTDWIQDLGNNPSMATTDLGKEIIDGFTTSSAQSSRSPQTTLSLIDLAELSHTVPDALNRFASSIEDLIESDGYSTVSTARSNSREFASTSRLDQVDLVNFGDNLGTEEGKALSDAVIGAVKYNRTSSTITNAYGLSIYFPSKSLNKVDTMTKTYEELGMDEAYTDCVRSYAKVEASGQAAAGGVSSAFPMLNGSSYSTIEVGSLESILEQFLGGDFESLNLDSAGFLSEAPLSDERTIQYITSHTFDTSQLSWQTEGDRTILSMDEENWSKVRKIEKNLFVDDGSGYIDMGLDNQFDINEDGAMIADTEGTWLAINNQPVAYYHINTVEREDGSYTIYGRVPVLLNTARANLIIVFDSDHPDGYVAGATYDYTEGETDTIAKNLVSLEDGDTIDYIANYYDYSGNYMDTYRIAETVTVETDEKSLSVSDVYVPEHMNLCYLFTDMYGQSYWTSPLLIDGTSR